MKGYVIQFAEWGWREYFSFCSSLWRNYKSKLISKISTVYPDSQVILLNSARAGLTLIFSRLMGTFPDKREVIIPDYICPSVTDTLSNLGLKVVSAPVGDDLNVYAESINELINSETLAVIAVHMYGCIAGVDEIQRVCDEREVVLIDDAAQLGVSIPGNILPGSYGDFGLISFAQSKTIVAGVRGSGGVLLINKAKWRVLFSDIAAQLNPAPARRIQFWYFLGEYLFDRSFRKIVYLVERLISKLGIPTRNYYALGTISNLDAAIAYYQYLSVAERTRLKCTVLKYYQKELEGCPMIEAPQIKEGRYLTRLFIEVKLDEKNYRKLRTMLFAKGVGTRNGYSGPKRLMELPLSSEMKSLDVQTIASKLRDSMQNFCVPIASKQ